MMDKDLLEAGFKEFKPNPLFERWEKGFQWPVRDGIGTRYFINCYFWWHYGGDGWEIKITYDGGCGWFPHESPLEIKIWGAMDKWTVREILDYANQLWERLHPNYYGPITAQ